MDAARGDARTSPRRGRPPKLPAPEVETVAFPIRGTPGGYHDVWDAADESATAQAEQASEDEAVPQAIAQDRETHAPRACPNDHRIGRLLEQHGPDAFLIAP